MMEILFRGKRLGTGDWIRGDLHQFNDQYDYMVDKFDFRYAVDHSTVGQYTGIKDKDGTQIFEGDTIKGLFYHEHEVIGIVSFADGSFGVKWMRGEVEMFTPFTSTCNVSWKVIGNIHDE